MPLDRPWEGPSASGLHAERSGASGDLRVLWREVVTHASVAKAIAGRVPLGSAAAAAGPTSAAAAAAAASGVGPGQSPLEAHEALSSALGGPDVYRHNETPPFPSSHMELHKAMQVCWYLALG